MAEAAYTRGYAKIQSGEHKVTVYYIGKEVPAPTGATLRDELRLLTGFLTAFIANIPDNPAKNPKESRTVGIAPEDLTDSGKPPPVVFFVSASHHLSIHESSKDQDNHITLFICSQAGWDAGRRGACVHVFARNERVEDGYEDWYLHNKQSKALGYMKEAAEEASKNELS